MTQVTLLFPSSTAADEMERLARYAARRTRTIKPKDDLMDEIDRATGEKGDNFLRRVVNQDWALDIYEFIWLAWDLERVPLWLVVELLRHRFVWRDFSLEQLSQRAISGVRLPFDTGNPEMDEKAKQYMDMLETKVLTSHVHPEDIREYVPQGVLTNLVIGCNARTAHDLFWKRCSKGLGGRGGAHPKFSEIADEMYMQARNVLPIVFERIMPSGDLVSINHALDVLAQHMDSVGPETQVTYRQALAEADELIRETFGIS